MEAFLLIALLINLGLSLWVASLAAARGRSKAGWFFLALFFSVLVALLGLLVVGESESKRAEKLMEETAAKDLLSEGFSGTPESLAEFAKKKAGTYRSKEPGARVDRIILIFACVALAIVAVAFL